MQLPVRDGFISGGELFRLIWRGYFIAVTGIFLVAFLVFGTAAMYSGAEPGMKLSEFALGLLLVPVIAAGQGLIIGSVVLFGHFVKPPRSSLSSNDPSNASN